MVSDRKQDTLPPHLFEACGELDFTDGEGMTQVETTVHVGVWKSSEPFGIFGLDIFHGLLGIEEFLIG